MKYIASMFLFTIFTSTIHASQCLVEYEDTEVVGIINKEVFAGPPNYESIDKGDSRQVFWILTTDKQYCGKGISPESGSLYDIDGTFNRIQIILTKDQYNDYRPLLSKPVRVSGKVVASMTGHHKTLMLINVNKIELLKFITPTISYEKLQILENNYKKVLINSVKTALKNTKKDLNSINPKFFANVAACHLASISAWPVNARMELLEVYSRSENAFSATKSFESKLDEYRESQVLTPSEVMEYVNMQILIYESCADKIKPERT